jgi:hypothetical protein
VAARFIIYIVDLHNPSQYTVHHRGDQYAIAKPTLSIIDLKIQKGPKHGHKDERDTCTSSPIIHPARTYRSNPCCAVSRLLTGDADGWVILWHTTSKRAVVVWRAHNHSILGFAAWAQDKIIT